MSHLWREIHREGITSLHKDNAPAACTLKSFKKFTRAERKLSKHEQTKSAISDNAARANHLIDWDEAIIIGQEHRRWKSESEERKYSTEEGTYLLSHVYDPLTGK